MRVLLVVNTAASSVTTYRRLVIEAALREAGEVELEVAYTERRGHATELARAGAASGVDVVVVFAGDGTLNEAANGLVGTDTALAPLPGGSTNVYARTIGVPRDDAEAARSVLRAAAEGSTRRVGLGLAGGRYFLFHLGIGFDAEVVHQVERHSRWKRYVAQGLFAAEVVNTSLRHWRFSDRRVAVELPGGERIDGCTVAVVSKTSPYTFVGPRRIEIAPEAGLDSRLSLTAVRARRVTTVLRALSSALGTGAALRHHRAVLHRWDLEALSVTATEPFPWQVDGDYLGETTELEITFAADALRLVIPLTGKGNARRDGAETEPVDAPSPPA